MSANRRPGDTVRPPTPGGVERVITSRPPRPRRSSIPKAVKVDSSARRRRPVRTTVDPRAEGGQISVRPERAQSQLDATHASTDEAAVPDREARIEGLVDELSRASPGSDEPIRKMLLAHGVDSVLPSLSAAFPGLLWVNLSRPHRPLRGAKRLSALCSAMVACGDPAVPYVEALLSSSQAEVRFCAALVAADLKSELLLPSLVERFADSQPAVRTAAMIALRASEELTGCHVLVADLVHALEHPDADYRDRARAAWTLGHMRRGDALPHLIEHVEHGAFGASVRDALRLLCARDYGPDRERWRGWWKRNRDRDRLQWLIEALDQVDIELRTVAIDELVLLTGEGFDRRTSVTNREDARALQDMFVAWQDRTES